MNKTEARLMLKIRLMVKNGKAEEAYHKLTSFLIAKRYSHDDEEAIKRHMIAHPENEKYSNEFAEYDGYCEMCKEKARKEVGL